jgi:hypothetical protein
MSVASYATYSRVRVIIIKELEILADGSLSVVVIIKEDTYMVATDRQTDEQS